MARRRRLSIGKRRTWDSARGPNGGRPQKSLNRRARRSGDLLALLSALFLRRGRSNQLRRQRFRQRSRGEAMNRFVIRKPMLAAACAVVLLVPAGSTRVMAQQGNDDWCSQDRWGRDRAGVCEIREFTVAATGGTLEVSGTNGGISVEGESRGDVRILAKVVATAETQQRAKMIADAVQLAPTLDRVQADGPRNLQNREGWSVSYRISVPRALNLSLRTSNGGITVREVESKVTFRTSNGGVKLIGLSGDVRGQTSNGGVDIDLEGTA